MILVAFSFWSSRSRFTNGMCNVIKDPALPWEEQMVAKDSRSLCPSTQINNLHDEVNLSGLDVEIFITEVQMH